MDSHLHTIGVASQVESRVNYSDLDLTGMMASKGKSPKTVLFQIGKIL